MAQFTNGAREGCNAIAYVTASSKELYETVSDPAQNLRLFRDWQKATQRCAQTSDWAGLSAATAALQQLYAVSKGKGGKKGKWGKEGMPTGKG